MGSEQTSVAAAKNLALPAALEACIGIYLILRAHKFEFRHDEDGTGVAIVGMCMLIFAQSMMVFSADPPRVPKAALIAFKGVLCVFSLYALVTTASKRSMPWPLWFQRFLALEREGRLSPFRPRRTRERDDEEDEDGGEGRGTSGPPPSWDGTSSTLEDFNIKAKLWLATTKAKPKMRGPLLLKSLTSTPFEVYKHWAKDSQWLQDPSNAEKLLEDMNRPERYGDDQQEHMLTAMSRVTYHLRRQKGEDWREFFSRWDTALRRVHQHSIQLPEEYEGFLLINGLLLTDVETKALLNFTHGCIKPSSIKSWLRKNETKLSAAELGADKDKKKTNQLLYTVEENFTEETQTDDEQDYPDEIKELEAHLIDLQTDQEDESIISEADAAEILATFVQQRKKSYVESIKNKKTKELARGYGNSGRSSTSYRSQFPPRDQRRQNSEESLAALKRRTRCDRCHQVGHWKRECRNPPAQPENVKSHETNYLENTNEVFFAGHLELDRQFSSVQPGTSPVGQLGFCTDFEPKHFGSATSAVYMDSDQGSGDVFGISDGVEHVVDVYGLFNLENWICNQTSRKPEVHDHTCATVDTGCQRLAIGAHTLELFGVHLPLPLHITMHKSINKFRSVHQTSITTKIANIPCSLGKRGSFLKPAVFEQENSVSAPFLISLSFLTHCKSCIILDPDKGLAIQFQNGKHVVPLHIGPSGALRIPLQEFTTEQIQCLGELQDSSRLHDCQEFEILRIQCSPCHTAVKVSEGTCPPLLPEKADSAKPNGPWEQQAKPSCRASPTSVVDRVVSNGAQVAPDPDPLQHDGGAATWRTSRTLWNPSSCSSEHGVRGLAGLSQLRGEGDQPPSTTRSPQHRDGGDSGQRDGVGLFHIVDGEGTQSDIVDCTKRQVDGQKEQDQGRQACGRGAGHRNDLRSPTSLSLPPSGDATHQPHREESTSDVLPLSQGPRTAVQVLRLDGDSALPGSEQLEVPTTTRRRAQNGLRDAAEDGAGELSPPQDRQEGHQWHSQEGELQPVQEGPVDHSSGFGIQQHVQEGDRERVRAVPAVPQVEAEPPGLDFRPLPPKIGRKIRAALKQAVAFWRQIQLILADDGNQGSATVDLMRRMNQEICTELQLHPRGSKRSHEIAEIMGLSHKQLRTVAEIYNPNCFGPLTHKFGLNPGRAFDVRLGDDLLDKNKRNEVKDYLRQVKPGLVLISPPCRMHSQLQNLSKHKRESMPHLMREYLKKKLEGDQLLQFAIEVCELCIELGLTFLFEHPYSASSWKHRAMERLLRLPNVFVTKADQCQFGLRGESGQLQRKATGFMTNDMNLAKELSKRCDGQHQHEVIIGGNRSRKAQEYPLELRETILRTYKNSINMEINVVTFEEIVEENNKINELFRLEFELLHQDADWQQAFDELNAQPLPEDAGRSPECLDDQVCHDHSESGDPKEPGDSKEPGNHKERPGPGHSPEHPSEVCQEQDQSEGKDLPLSGRFTLSRLLQRAHEGLGHPSLERFLRILRYAKAKPEIIEQAKKMKCSVCERHQQVRPARRSAPPRELGFNDCVGIDVVYLPTPDKRTKPALNILDWGTKFQLVVPLQGKKPQYVREGYRHWLRIFGAPKRLAIDLGREFKGDFVKLVEADGSYVDPSAVETPQQRGMTERHGKTLKFILLKAMDTYSCTNMQDWEDLVSVSCMMKNRMMSVSGFSPCQRVLGYNPNIPGGILSGGHGEISRTTGAKITDLSIERSMKLRKAAAQAFIEADSNDALRRAISSGPRPWIDYEIGELVYFYRMGADKQLKFHPGYWQGPVRIVMTDLPSTIWLSHRGNLVKASPERIRRASLEENMSISGWLEDIVSAKKDVATEPHRGYLDLSDHPLPPEEPDALENVEEQSEGYDPSIAPEDINQPDDIPPDAQLPENKFDIPIKRQRVKGPQAFGPVVPQAVLPAPQPEAPEIEMEEPSSNLSEEPAHHKREHEDQDEEHEEGHQVKRSRTEYLEVYFMKVENLLKNKQKKEIKYQALDNKSKKNFDAAIKKEFNNNTDIGAYKVLSIEESAMVRRTMPDKIMESRLVLTAKPLEPHEVEPARQEGLLLDQARGDMDSEPCKAKARHVMKGYSEEGADEIEAATPQVTREGTLTVAQLIASHHWLLGFLDFTQAFHSGDQIQRLLFATQPREGIPGLSPSQLLKLEKVCYGLTDGPLAWFVHLKKFLTTKLKYQQSLADPCIYYKINENGKLSGVIAVATDDLLHGGDEQHLQAMEEIRRNYKLGKYQFGKGKFTGKYFEQQEDYSIVINQAHYVAEKLYDIPIEKSRKKQRFSICTEREVSNLRTSVGALSWLSKESRPDLAGRVALLQQAFPRPRVKDLVEANTITAEARKYPESGIKIMPIEPQHLRVGVATDASWANAKDKEQLETNSSDYWEETATHWIRHHTSPRMTLFHPGAVEGPDLHHLQPGRRTVDQQGRVLEDEWIRGNSIRVWNSEAWTGKTYFGKQPPGHELSASEINDVFLKLLNCSSQGGFVMMFYDKRMETEKTPQMVSVTAWKSTKLKRKTVNTLSAECQALIHGVGQIHWHRYLLLELLGHDMATHEWEKHLNSIPYVSVVDSRSLYDCINKLVCTFSQVEDKRTAIDLAILKDDMNRTSGSLRWVAGTNMITDPMTKRMSANFLRYVCNHGYWCLFFVYVISSVPVCFMIYAAAMHGKSTEKTRLNELSVSERAAIHG
eukprot:s153_g17.t2